jgi:hypothetical protein
MTPQKLSVRIGPGATGRASWSTHRRTRADKYDTSETARTHPLHRSLGQQHRRAQMQLSQRQNVLRLRIGQQVGQDDAGIVHETVDGVIPANLLRDGTRFVDAGQVRAIGRKQIMRPARLLQPDRDHALPFLDELPCQSFADPGIAPGDECGADLAHDRLPANDRRQICRFLRSRRSWNALSRISFATKSFNPARWIFSVAVKGRLSTKLIQPGAL